MDKSLELDNPVLVEVRDIVPCEIDWVAETDFDLSFLDKLMVSVLSEVKLNAEIVSEAVIALVGDRPDSVSVVEDDLDISRERLFGETDCERL